MTKEVWYSTLLEKYPRVFKNLTYLECGSGWHNLIDSLCSIIESHLEHIEWRVSNPDSPVNKDFDHETNKNLLDLFTAVQVKEKFGGLRFYTSCTNDYISGAISMAENMSFHICETCGAPGENKVLGSWYMTLCKDHFREQKDKREERISKSATEFMKNNKGD